MFEQTSTGYFQNQYKFNGKELDQETSLYYYGARYYDPKGSLWLSVDPLEEKKPWMSPYVYCSRNPVNRIYPDGRDDTYYNSKGVQPKVVERSWLFELFAGNRNYISDDKGKIFKLTNQALDVIKSCKFKGFESNWETSNSKTGFNSLLNNATNPKRKENDFTYVFKESKDRGYLDQKQNLDPCKIYGASGYAMNKNEAGNYVWVAVLAKFGFSTSDAIILANGGALYLATISRPSRECRGWGINDIEYRLSRARFDEPDELKAIEAGSIKIIGFQIVY